MPHRPGDRGSALLQEVALSVAVPAAASQPGGGEFVRVDVVVVCRPVGTCEEAFPEDGYAPVRGPDRLHSTPT